MDLPTVLRFDSHFFACILILLVTKRILGHPAGQEFERISTIIIEIAVHIQASAFQQWLQFSLFELHASINSSSHKRALYKELWKGIAARLGRQGGPILVAHVVLGKFKAVNVNERVRNL
jgi:ATP/ADP translocase